MSANKSCLISIVGPTAVGKTLKAIELAELLGTEIISADSRQFYREMEIGTAKPTANELNRLNHHFINSRSVRDFYSAGAFERDALKLLEKSFAKNPTLIAVGGSGLYLKALWQGLDDLPGVNEKVRETLNQEFRKEGLKKLLQELEANDPEYYAVVDRQNQQRVIRALEVIRVTGKPFSSFRNEAKKENRFFKNIKVGLEMDRGMLNQRIEERMDQMISTGLFEEAESLHPLRHLNALQTVGYKEIHDYMDGQYDREEAVRLLKRNSRRYAKRQMTWFRADKEIIWFDAATPAQEILISLQLT